MKQTDKLKRIEMPNVNEKNEYICYEKRMQPKVTFETKRLKALYQRHETELLAMAEREAYNYLVEFGAWDILPEEGFPCGEEMTGEWYVAEVYLEKDEEIRGSIYMHFLGHYAPPTARNIIDDYLGMDFMFHYDSKTKAFVFESFNTASI